MKGEKIFDGLVSRHRKKLLLGNMGTKMRALRLHLNLTPEQLAAQLGWRVSLVLLVETGSIGLSNGQHADLEKWVEGMRRERAT